MYAVRREERRHQITTLLGQGFKVREPEIYFYPASPDAETIQEILYDLPITVTRGPEKAWYF